MGKIFCWREENCGRVRALYATTPPMKDLDGPVSLELQKEE